MNTDMLVLRLQGLRRFFQGCLAVPFVVCFWGIGYPLPIAACDESLLRILTADDPNGPFTQSIIGLHKRLADLGTELKNRSPENHEKSLEGLMQAWLEFSNRYMINPPEQARGDPNWQKKMENAASRIGEIRKAVREARFLDAHDTTLLLSTEIAVFFECFGLSPLKRLFLEVSTGFELCERARGQGNILLVEQALASLTAHLEALVPRLTSETRPLHERASLAMVQLRKSLHEPSEIATAAFLAHLDGAREDFQKFRDRQLMYEWFSPSPQPASAPTGIVPASPTVSPATTTESR